MEKFFGELIAIRLLLGRVLANQAHLSKNPEVFMDDQLKQSIEDLKSVNIMAKDDTQEALIRNMAEVSLKDIMQRITFLD